MNEDLKFKKFVYETITDIIGKLTTNDIDKSEAFQLFIKKIYEFENKEQKKK